jgi:Family of unknown function (DUF6527)
MNNAVRDEAIWPSPGWPKLEPPWNSVIKLDDRHAVVKLFWNGVWCGIDEWHLRPHIEGIDWPQTDEKGDVWCVGYCLFAVPEADAYADAYCGGQRESRWQVQSYDPLTLSPSIQCGVKGCSSHGFIQQGTWVGA